MTENSEKVSWAASDMHWKYRAIWVIVQILKVHLMSLLSRRNLRSWREFCSCELPKQKMCICFSAKGLLKSVNSELCEKSQNCKTLYKHSRVYLTTLIYKLSTQTLFSSECWIYILQLMICDFEMHFWGKKFEVKFINQYCEINSIVS